MFRTEAPRPVGHCCGSGEGVVVTVTRREVKGSGWTVEAEPRGLADGLEGGVEAKGRIKTDLKVLICTAGRTEVPLLNERMKFQTKRSGLEQGSGSREFHLALGFWSRRG